MSEYESVSELVNKTGATYNEAKYAYEACSGDMLAAIIMLEKAKNAADKGKGVSLKKGAADCPPAVRAAAKDKAQSAKELFKRICGKNVKISGSREFCDLPLPAFAIIVAAGWSISLPAVVISLFCGVNYTISGQGDKDIVIGIPRRAQQSGRPVGAQQYANNEPAMGYTQMPHPEQQTRPPQYAGSSNPLDSEDKGFFG